MAGSANRPSSSAHRVTRSLDIRRGDVVLVDLRGAVGGEKMGKRPCLVVQNDAGNLRSAVTIIATITDRKKYRGFPMQVLVGAEEMGSMGTDSVVECGQLRPLTATLAFIRFCLACRLKPCSVSLPVSRRAWNSNAISRCPKHLETTMTLTRTKFMLALSAASLAQACFGQGAPADPTVPPTQKMQIAFSAQVAGKPFSCGETYEDIGLAKTKIRGSDMRFFVSSVELLTEDGNGVPLQLDQDGIWQYKNLALLDFEDGKGSCSNGNAAMHKEVSGTILPGKYVGLRFTLGVPFELDHIDAASAPSPLNTSAMFWVWQSGYKFLRAEVKIVNSPMVPVSASGEQMSANGMKSKPRSSGFPMHLGSTGCAGTTVTSAPTLECEHPNRPVITLASFNPETDTVVFDLAKLLQGIDITGGPASAGVGCMSSPKSDACGGPMQALGLPFRDGAPTEQVVFSRGVRE
jgi:uncharacterized repeat protein (TIGR04052 family)